MPEQDEPAAAPADAQPIDGAEAITSDDEARDAVVSDDVDEARPDSDASDEPSSEEPRPVVADEVLLASAALAQRALLEVTPPETVGSVVGHIVEDAHVLTLLFAADLAGYPGWHWSVTIARVDGGEPTVVETELMPGEQALVAPEWVPWSVRLAEYRAAQAATAAEAAERGEEIDEEFAEGGFVADGELDADDDELDDDDEDELDEDELDEAEPDDDPDADEFDEGRSDGFDDHDEHFDDHDEAFDGIEIDALDETGVGEGDSDDAQPADGDLDPTTPRP